MKKKQLDTKLIIIIIIALLSILINIKIAMDKIFIPMLNNQNIQIQYERLLKTEQEALEKAKTEKTEEEKKNEELESLKNAGERARMNFYFSKYITAIEEKKYTEAYSYLYNEFKNNYFKTIEEYTTYIQNRYPKVISVEYDEFERQGEYYILTVTISDMINQDEQTKFTQRFVIKENNFNDFVLSFQLKEKEE